MLIQFRFKNFKSFRDDTIIDLSATKITEHSGHITKIGNEKLLPMAAILGANASGKSNVVEAFRFMKTYVMESFSYGGEIDQKRPKQKTCIPFLFDNASKDSESHFEVFFVLSENLDCKFYNYGFILNKGKVEEEWLNVKAKTAKDYKLVFYRGPDEIDLSGLPPKTRDNITIALEPESLIVSLGAKLKIEKLKSIRDWFSIIGFADFGNPIENFVLSRRVPGGFTDKNLQQKVVDYFSTFDSSIVGFHVEELKEDVEDTGNYKLKIATVHKMIDSEDTAEIPMSQESAGTLKMLALYPVLQKVLETGGILFVDELNARLHPLLVRNFLITFLNPKLNPHHAQIVFTTHDSWQLSNNLLRRDEIWFTEKDNRGVSSLYSLVDFVDESGTKVRKDESYEKNYLLGRYGAIPSLEHLKVLGEEIL